MHFHRKKLKIKLFKKSRLRLLIFIFIINVFFFLNLPAAHAATFTVTNANNSGAGSLRQMIIDSNGAAGADLILFSGSFTITLTTQLPNITGQLTIDGGANTIIIQKANPPGGVGITIGNPGVAGTSSCVIKNLRITNFDDGIVITHDNSDSNTIEACRIYANTGDGIEINAGDSNTIRGCYIGTIDGTADNGNSANGINIYGGAQLNTIGGTVTADRNIISGNGQNGIYIDATNSNIVTGNYIGLNSAGTTALPNDNNGIYIYNGAQSNTIGGTTSGERNVISGNVLSGIAIGYSTASSNTVTGNYIGLNAAGTSAVANGNSGVSISNGAQSNTIGGNTSGKRNIISGNTQYGVFITGSNTNSNTVQGNYIGTNAAGDSDVGNTRHGVFISSSAQSNTIGGTGSGEGNKIAYNGDATYTDNVRADGAATQYNKILQNSIHDGQSGGKGISLTNGANEGISAPTISIASTTTVTGTGGTNGGRVEVFIVDSQGSNEGKTFAGFATANADGTWSCSVNGVSEGNYLNAACTNTSNSTSEFSSNLLAFGPLDHFAVSIATPQTNGAAFTGACTLTAQDSSNNTILNFNASTNNVTMTSTPADGTISGLGSGSNNILNQAGDFSSGVANLTSLGMKFTGASGSHTFTGTSADSKTGTSGTVAVSSGTITKLAIITSAQSITANTATGVITVQTQDSSSNPSSVGSSTTISLSSSSSSGKFDTSSTGNFNGSVASITISTGTNSANFYYKDSLSAAPTITCAESPSQGWIDSTQTETINAPLNSGKVEGYAFNDINRNHQLDPGEAFQGAKIQIKNSGGQVVNTLYSSGTGYYAADLEAGTYIFNLSEIPNFDPFQATVEVSSGGDIEFGSAFIDPAGVVYDSITKEPLAGATVTITETNTGLVGYQTVTNQSGKYNWAFAFARRYTITVTPPAGYSFPSTIIPATGAPDPLPGPALNDMQALTSGVYYLNFTLAAGSGDLIGNDIPLDIQSFQNLRIQKSSNKKFASIGDVLVYTITIENPNNFAVNNFKIIDTPPVQIKYIDKSAYLNTTGTLTPAGTFPLSFNNLSVPANGKIILTYKSVVGSHAKLKGTYTNSARAISITGNSISSTVTAQVKIILDPLFDEATVIGIVFNDENKNGTFDMGEAGIGNVRIYSIEGVCVITDEEGKFHFSALKPDTIHVFKVDISSLPQGFKLTTENPRWMKLTRGSLHEINFGAAK